MNLNSQVFNAMVREINEYNIILSSPRLSLESRQEHQVAREQSIKDLEEFIERNKGVIL